MKFAVARIFDRVVQIGHAWARDTCSCKGQLEKTRSWKFLVRKSKVRNFPFKLESTDRSWKVFHAVLNKKNFINLGSHFPTSFFLIHSFSRQNHSAWDFDAVMNGLCYFNHYQCWIINWFYEKFKILVNQTSCKCTSVHFSKKRVKSKIHSGGNQNNN